MKARWAIALGVAGLVASILACNAPTETPGAATASATSLPTKEEVGPGATPTPTSAQPTATATPAATATEPPTTAATATKPVPTATAPPTATPTQPAEGEPLEIVDPGFVLVDWQSLPDSGEWEGHLRVVFQGGVPPHTFALEGNEPQDENHLYVRWRACRGAPLTVRVWSADGQEAHRAIWLESPYCPESSD